MQGHQETPNASGRLLTTEQLCAYTGLSPRTVRELLSRGAIPVTKIGRLNRFDIVEIDRWIKRNTIRGAA